MRARLNDVQVFLSEENPPGFSSTLNDLLDITKVKGLDSSTVEVIATPSAKRQLGGENMAEMVRTRGHVLRMGNDDRDHFRSEFVPTRWDRDKIEGYCRGGNHSWFEYAKNTGLREVDFGAITVNTVNMGASWSTRGMVWWPLVDHGEFEDRATYGFPDPEPSGDPHNTAPLQLRPALSIYQMIYYAMYAAGYFVDFKPNVLKQIEPGYIDAGENLNCTTAIDKVREGDWQDWDAAGGTDFYPINANGTMPDAASNLSSAENINWQGGQYEAPETGMAQFGPLSYWFLLQGAVPGEEFRLVLWHVENAEAVAEIPYICTGTELSLNGGDYIHFEGTFPDVFMVAGQHLRVGVTGDTIHTDGIAVRPSPGYSSDLFATVRTYGGEYAVNSDLEIASAAPSMTVAELMSFAASWLGLVYVTGPPPPNGGLTGSITVWFEKDYFRKPSQGTPYRDWSGRIDHTTATAKTNENIPARYQYRWLEDEGDKSLNKALQLTEEPGYGNKNEAVPRGKDKDIIVQMPFAPTAMGPMFGSDGGFEIPVMRREGSYKVDDYGYQPRLLMHGFTRTGSWLFDGNSLTSYPWGYFVSDREQDMPAHFGLPLFYGGQQPSVLDLYQQQRLRRLRDCLLLECRMVIHDHEMIDFDHGLPTLVDDGFGPKWFWVHEIRNHIFGAHGTTEVILVEIPGAEVAFDQPEQPALTYPTVATAPEVSFAVVSDCGGGEFTITAIASTPIAYYYVQVNGGDVNSIAYTGSPQVLGTFDEDDVVNLAYSYGDDITVYMGNYTSDCAEDPCEGVALFPFAHIANFICYSNERAIYDAAMSVGEVVYIVDHIGSFPLPGSDEFETHTGCFATRVADGTGSGGGNFIYVPLLDGDLIRIASYIGQTEEYWLNVEQVGSTLYTDNGGTGRFGVPYFSGIVSQDPGPGANTALMDMASRLTGVASTRLDHLDGCRTFVVERCDDGIGGPWLGVDVPAGPRPETVDSWAPNDFLLDYDTSGWGGNPYIRCAWYRGGVLQGYSFPSPATV